MQTIVAQGDTIPAERLGSFEDHSALRGDAAALAEAAHRMRARSPPAPRAPTFALVRRLVRSNFFI